MDSKRLVGSFDTIYLGSIEAMLKQAGIRVEKRNEFASGGFGELPPMEVMPELWVDVVAYEEAEALFQQLQGDEFSVTADWVCLQCGEQAEGQYAQCWRCGHWRDNE